MSNLLNTLKEIITVREEGAPLTIMAMVLLSQEEMDAHFGDNAELIRQAVESGSVVRDAVVYVNWKLLQNALRKTGGQSLVDDVRLSIGMKTEAEAKAEREQSKTVLTEDSRDILLRMAGSLASLGGDPKVCPICKEAYTEQVAKGASHEIVINVGGTVLTTTCDSDVASQIRGMIRLKKDADLAKRLFKPIPPEPEGFEDPDYGF